MKLKKTQTENGFSLLELVVVVFVITLLTLMGGLSYGLVTKQAKNSSSGKLTIAEAKAKVIESNTAYDYSDIQCSDTETQVANAYLLASTIENHNTSTPLDTYGKITISGKEVTASNPDSELLTSNGFKKAVKNANCYTIVVTADKNSKDFKISMDNASNNDAGTIYDSSKSEDRKALQKLTEKGNIM